MQSNISLKTRQTNFMKKNIIIISFVSFFLIMAVSCLLPYPIMSNYANISTFQIEKINDFWENELKNECQNKSTLIKLSWKDLSPLLPVGEKLCIYDIENENYFNVKRIGGRNHADVVPLNDEDEKIITSFGQNKKCYPVFVKLNSQAFAPASFSSYRHGYQSHFCLHFLGSKTDGTNLPSKMHQSAIKKAQNSPIPQ